MTLVVLFFLTIFMPWWAMAYQPECLQEDSLVVCYLSGLSPDQFRSRQLRNASRIEVRCPDSRPLNIDSVTLGAFENAVELSIFKCKVDMIRTGAFRGLSKLHSLMIEGDIEDPDGYSLTIGPRTFEDTPYLTTLNLGHNNLYLIQPSIFCPLRNIKHLNLTHNRWDGMTTFGFNTKFTSKDADAAYPCGQLIEILDLSHNRLKVIPGESMINLVNTRGLHLQSNVLDTLEEASLAGLESLTVLNLSKNKLSILPPSLLAQSKKLTEVYLQNNLIRVLAPGLLSNLHKLIVLDLSFNQLTSDWVTVGTFPGLRELRYLSLAHNHLRKIDSNLLADSSLLEFLDFSYNDIEIVSNGAFRKMKQLETLLLSFNKLQVMSFDMFAGLEGLKFLSLENNQILRIDPLTLSCCQSLDHLVISKNNLTSVPNVKFLKNLQSLDLSFNNISVLNDVFANISEVSTLSLAHNSLKFITESTFRYLVNLKVLDLSSNQIEYIETSSFSHVRELQALRVDSNKLAEIGDILVNSVNLEWLNISANQISLLNCSKLPSKLIWLDAHQNEIHSIKYDSYHLDKMKLETLDLSFNLLTELGPFLPKTLHTLNVNDNRIEKVQPYTFFSMSNLQRVDLFANLIKQLDKDSLRVQPSFPAPEFYVGGNPFECDCNMQWLQTVNTPDQLSTLPKVKDLESIYCLLTHKRGQVHVPLVEAASHNFLCQYNVHCSAVCHCCEFDACDCEMICPDSCRCYHDHAWSSNVADCSSNNLTSVPSGLPIDVTDLYMDNNDVKEIADLIFIGRRNLRTLYLNSSQVETVGSRSFNGLRSLTRLHMGDNVLRKLPSDVFLELEALVELRLENNLLEELSPDLFRPLRSLQTLRLDGNLITVIDPSHIFSGNLKLQVLNISGNPWSCECDFMKEFSAWLIFNEKKVISANSLKCKEHVLIMNKNRTCTIPSSAKTIIEPTNYLPLLISTLVVSAIIMFTAIVLYLYRYDIRVWCHARYGVRLFGQSEPVTELYNSFVAYSSKDEPFVIQTLTSNLEYGHGYKLCLQYRDCIPSAMFVSDSVLQGIENSQRIMLILSENFLNSEWQRLKAALHHIFKTRRRKVIVVIVGTVNLKDLDHDLKLYMKTSAKLVWGENRFWEKLKYELVDVKKRRRTTPSLPIPPVPNVDIDMSHYTTPPL